MPHSISKTLDIANSQSSSHREAKVLDNSIGEFAGFQKRDIIRRLNLRRPHQPNLGQPMCSTISANNSLYDKVANSFIKYTSIEFQNKSHICTSSKQSVLTTPSTPLFLAGLLNPPNQSLSKVRSLKTPTDLNSKILASARWTAKRKLNNPLRSLSNSNASGCDLVSLLEQSNQQPKLPADFTSFMKAPPAKAANDSCSPRVDILESLHLQQQHISQMEKVVQPQRSQMVAELSALSYSAGDGLSSCHLVSNPNFTDLENLVRRNSTALNIGDEDEHPSQSERFEVKVNPRDILGTAGKIPLEQTNRAKYLAPTAKPRTGRRSILANTVSRPEQPRVSADPQPRCNKKVSFNPYKMVLPFSPMSG